jgi:hypothetical protein
MKSPWQPRVWMVVLVSACAVLVCLLLAGRVWLRTHAWPSIVIAALPAAGPSAADYRRLNDSPLAAWDRALRNCRNQAVSIDIYGTSRSIVDANVTPHSGFDVTFDGRWVNRLARTLQQQCGSHGSGVVPFRWEFGDLAHRGLNADYFHVSGPLAAEDTALGPYQGKDAMDITAVQPTTIDFDAHTKYDHLRMFCAAGPGLHRWRLVIDGTEAGGCGGSESPREVAVTGTTGALPLGEHAARLVCGEPPCAGYAVEAIAGTTGVSINNFSVGGASVEIFAAAPETQLAFSRLSHQGVALEIIEEGCNEVGPATTAAQFRTSMDNLVSYARASGHPASVLLVAELQDKIAGQHPYYDVIAAIVKQEHTAYVDMRARWGERRAPLFLFEPDEIHESNAGNSEMYSAVLRAID